MKTELLKPLEAKEIAHVWNSHFAQQSHVLSGSLSSEFYEKLTNNLKQFPFFVLPCPKEGQGYEFYFLQAVGHQIYITSLIEYQTKQSFARPLFIFNHYTELSESKGIVLMMGEYADAMSASSEKEKNGDYKPPLTLIEAQNLIYQLQYFYMTGGQKAFGLVEKFHKNPQVFDYQELITLLEQSLTGAK